MMHFLKRIFAAEQHLTYHILGLRFKGVDSHSAAIQGFSSKLLTRVHDHLEFHNCEMTSGTSGWDFRLSTVMVRWAQCYQFFRWAGPRSLTCLKCSLRQWEKLIPVPWGRHKHGWRNNYSYLNKVLLWTNHGNSTLSNLYMQTHLKD